MADVSMVITAGGVPADTNTPITGPVLGPNAVTRAAVPQVSTPASADATTSEVIAKRPRGRPRKQPV